MLARKPQYLKIPLSTPNVTLQLLGVAQNISNTLLLTYRVIFNDIDKVNSLKHFFWLAIIILIIYFMDSCLVHFDNKI